MQHGESDQQDNQYTSQAEIIDRHKPKIIRMACPAKTEASEATTTPRIATEAIRAFRRRIILR